MSDNPYLHLLDDPVRLDQYEHQAELHDGMAVSYSDPAPECTVWGAGQTIRARRASHTLGDGE